MQRNIRGRVALAAFAMACAASGDAARRPPAPSAPEAYLFVYFTGDTIDGEKIRFAVSDGNNALSWKTLNDGRPVLESRRGTRGLRDPFIIRSKDGDRFFLLATDLSVGRTGWGGSTTRGSRYLEIWESTDLVRWGAQRHVQVSAPDAGMTWAPEASYDPTIGAYAVYWTSTLYTDAAHGRDDGNGPQILMATTRDFRTFTPAKPYFKAADLPELIRKNGLIDATVLKDGGLFYRFTKVSQAQGCPSPDIIAQRSSSLRATGASGAWQMVSRCIGRNAGTPEVEGPTAFVANPGDTSGFRYFLWVDNYGGVGYIPLATNSLEGTVTWTYPKTFHLPASPRHGTVLPITAQEHDALAARWNRSLLVTAVGPVTLSVKAGARSASLPSSVVATFADGHTDRVGVRWAAPDWLTLRRPGDRVTVTGKLAHSSAKRATATIVAAR